MNNQFLYAEMCFHKRGRDCGSLLQNVIHLFLTVSQKIVMTSSVFLLDGHSILTGQSPPPFLMMRQKVCDTYANLSQRIPRDGPRCHCANSRRDARGVRNFHAAAVIRPRRGAEGWTLHSCQIMLKNQIFSPLEPTFSRTTWQTWWADVRGRGGAASLFPNSPRSSAQTPFEAGARSLRRNNRHNEPIRSQRIQCGIGTVIGGSLFVA